ncbi:hypothetical protein TrVE_jg14500 [Triparma verrucosa]|uniref:PPM-type phosphatase domain-containing protein n=1 Tax=Triparma verrucosa TaxID=1606542 RepID=A0A9W6ZAI8_9STRA|nr:hypothetical protein TrVE_jg14500 [Triparma verrucosa]
MSTFTSTLPPPFPQTSLQETLVDGSKKAVQTSSESSSELGERSGSIQLNDVGVDYSPTKKTKVAMAIPPPDISNSSSKINPQKDPLHQHTDTVTVTVVKSKISPVSSSSVSVSVSDTSPCGPLPVANPSGVHSVSSYDANNPSEDRSASITDLQLCYDGKSYGLNVFAVFDGHGGAKVAEYGSRCLLPEVLNKLKQSGGEVKGGEMHNSEGFLDWTASKLDRGNVGKRSCANCSQETFSVDSSPSQSPPTPPSPSPSPTSPHVIPSPPGLNLVLKKSLMESFTLLDQSYLNSVDCTKSQKSCQPNGAWNAGSCALVAVVYREKGSDEINIITGHCGDCRAVVCCRQVPKSKSESEMIEPNLSQEDSEGFKIDEDEDDPLNWGSKKRKRDGEKSPQPSSTSASASPEQSSSRWHPYELTLDHNCYNSTEIKLVQARTEDPNSISQASKGGIKRVAGSLAVTRALGDAYLKSEKLSFHPYKAHCPYITAVPVVEEYSGTGTLNPFMVMASDGVWEHLPNKAVTLTLQNHREGKPVSAKKDDKGRVSSTPSEAILNATLDKICTIRKKSRQELEMLKKGRGRRGKHDDITVLVVDLEKV